MSWAKWKGKILLVHRWIALAISPVLLLVVLSGAVLAFRPLLGRAAEPRSTGKVDATGLIALLREVDPQGTSRGLLISEDGKTVEIRGANKEQGNLGTFDIESKARVAPASKIDVFDLAQKGHRGLFVGIHQLSDVATYALVAVLLLGPFIAWPRRRNTLMGWHTAMGWFLLPFSALGPITAVMLMLHIGSGPRGGGGGPKGEGRRGGGEASAPIADFIQSALQHGTDLRSLRAVAKQGQNTLLTVVTPQGLQYHQVSRNGSVAEAKPAPSAIKQLHEGTWAGPLSASLSLLGAASLAAMLVTGLWSWVRKALRKKSKKPRAAAA
jgi:sulfite reductase (NADPH) flavoprotein alpha-component